MFHLLLSAMFVISTVAHSRHSPRLVRLHKEIQRRNASLISDINILVVNITEVTRSVAVGELQRTTVDFHESPLNRTSTLSVLSAATNMRSSANPSASTLIGNHEAGLAKQHSLSFEAKNHRSASDTTSSVILTSSPTYNFSSKTREAANVVDSTITNLFSAPTPKIPETPFSLSQTPTAVASLGSSMPSGKIWNGSFRLNGIYSVATDSASSATVLSIAKESETVNIDNFMTHANSMNSSVWPTPTSSVSYFAASWATNAQLSSAGSSTENSVAKTIGSWPLLYASSSILRPVLESLYTNSAGAPSTPSSTHHITGSISSTVKGRMDSVPVASPNTINLGSPIASGTSGVVPLEFPTNDTTTSRSPVQAQGPSVSPTSSTKTLSLPTIVITERHSAIITSAQNGMGRPSPVTTRGSLLTALPAAISLNGDITLPDESEMIVQIGFTGGLNYPFVAGNSLTTAQLMAYLPKAVAYALDVPRPLIKVNSLRPYQMDGYVATIGYLILPKDKVPALRELLQMSNSRLYHQEADSEQSIVTLIDKKIPLLATEATSGLLDVPSGSISEGQTLAGIGSSLGSLADTSNGANTSINVGRVVGLGVGAAVAAGVYASMIFVFAERMRKKRMFKRGHWRTNSVNTGFWEHKTQQDALVSRWGATISMPYRSENSLGIAR